MKELDPNELPKEEKAVEDMLMNQLPDFKASPTIDLEKSIVDKIKATPKQEPSSARFEWKMMAAAAVILVALGITFTLNNRVISQSEYVDDSISLIQLFGDTVANFQGQGGEDTTKTTNQPNRLNQMVMDMSGASLFSDIALITYDSDTIKDL